MPLEKISFELFLLQQGINNKSDFLFNLGTETDQREEILIQTC